MVTPAFSFWLNHRWFILQDAVCLDPISEAPTYFLESLSFTLALVAPPFSTTGPQKASINTGGFMAEDGDVGPAVPYHKFTNQPSSRSSSPSSSCCAQRRQKGPQLGRLSRKFREETRSL